MAEAQILVARRGGIVVIRVLGRATFKVSRDLREYGVRVIQEDATSVIVDLSECKGMDSTFIGVLAMIGLEGHDKVELVIVNANDAHRRLLESIGVSRLWKFTEEPVPDVDWKSLCVAASGAADIKSLGSTVMDAHQTLMDLDPQNVPKFKDVVELLTAEMGENEMKEGNK